jgi:hypothetical protein
MLVCAPTGAGKTNIAMITVLREVGANRDPSGWIDKGGFKIVYVAPMKALAAEVGGPEGGGALGGGRVRRGKEGWGATGSALGGLPGGAAGAAVRPPRFAPSHGPSLILMAPPPPCQVTANFGKRLAPLGLAVRELTGDMQLSKRELAETQMVGGR